MNTARAITIGLLLLAPAAWAQEPARTPAAPDPAGEPVRAFLARTCLECHGPEKAKGKFRVDQLDYSLAAKGAQERWLAVREQLTTGVMPPKAKPRAAKADIDAVAAW